MALLTNKNVAGSTFERSSIKKVNTNSMNYLVPVWSPDQGYKMPEETNEKGEPSVLYYHIMCICLF